MDFDEALERACLRIMQKNPSAKIDEYKIDTGSHQPVQYKNGRWVVSVPTIIRFCVYDGHVAHTFEFSFDGYFKEL